MAEIPQQPKVLPVSDALTEEELKKRIMLGYAESMKQQQEQVKAFKDMLAQRIALEEQGGTLGQLDLRPFAQALQQYGATNVAVPESAPVDPIALKLKLQEAVSDAQQGLGKQQLDYLRSQLLALREGKAGKQAQQSAENFNLRLRSTINTSEEAKKIRNIGALNTKLSNLENLVNKTGAELTGKEKAALDSAFRDAEVAWKEAANLGALTGPDVGMIQGALGQSPTSLAGIGRYAISGGKEGLLAKIRGARQRATTEGKGHLESLQAVFPYDQAMPIYQDLNKKLEVPESEADKIRKELKALKESK